MQFVKFFSLKSVELVSKMNLSELDARHNGESTDFSRNRKSEVARKELDVISGSRPTLSLWDFLP